MHRTLAGRERARTSERVHYRGHRTQRPSVFADPSGRRRRLVKIATGVIVTAATIAVCVILAAGMATPWQKQQFDLDAIAPRGADRHLPVLGEGPVERVGFVHRSNKGVWVTDLATGKWIRPLTAAEAATIGDATHVLDRTGYHPSEKTLLITFDDGPDREITQQLLDGLSKAGVPATFFVLGSFVAQNPDIIDRMVREGHAVGGHTVHHPHMGEFPRWRQQYELVTTERLIRAAAGASSSIWRQPYDDSIGANGQKSIGSLLLAQQSGYTHIGYDFDTTDWEIVVRPGATAGDIPLPDFESGRSMTVLLHDAGGPNRKVSVDYTLNRLIPAAAAHGYSFRTVQSGNTGAAAANVRVAPSWADKTTLIVTKALFQWPTSVMLVLFVTTLTLAFTFGAVNTVLALIRHRRRRRTTWGDPSQWPLIPVTVLLAAFNEEAVIERTIRSVLRSDYPILEVLVVDDGSTDRTAGIVRELAEQDSRVRLLTQTNAGKSAALNTGIARLRGEIVVTIDADTLVTPTTVTNLVRRFVHDTEGDLGAVAGVVRVGNRSTNLLTRWQALEYVAQIGIERAAQSLVNGIAIVPGACAAWRRTALLASGGFPAETLAEDADLAMTMHENDWRVEQDDEAYAFTEAPQTLDDLLKQRVRWTFGIMQATWKHRRLLFNTKHLGIGFYVLPNYVVSLLVPLLLLPLTVVMTVLAFQSGGAAVVALGFAVFVAFQFVQAAIAVTLMGESRKHLLMVPLYRVIFEPLRAYLLYATVVAAVKGTEVKWNRVTRNGTVDATLDEPLAGADASLPAQLAAAPEETLIEPSRSLVLAGGPR